jgi:predicted nucleic acid-binding protein
MLRELFSEVVMPQGVYQEIAVGGVGLPVDHAVQGALTSWLSVRRVENAAEVDRLQHAGLDGGESEAIEITSCADGGRGSLALRFGASLSRAS